MSGPEFNTAGRPRILINGERSERLETDLIRLEARSDCAGVASVEAVFVNWGSREAGQPVDYVHFDRASLDFGATLKVTDDAST